MRSIVQQGRTVQFHKLSYLQVDLQTSPLPLFAVYAGSKISSKSLLGFAKLGKQIDFKFILCHLLE